MPRPLRWMHHLSPVLQVGLAKPERHGSVSGRRQQQRQRLLMELLSAAELPINSGDGRFWRALRWGGAGLLLGQALHYFLPG